MNDEEFKIPRYTLDLIEWLESNILAPTLPASASGFGTMDGAAVRQAAFKAGARSLVDYLREWHTASVADQDAEDAPEDSEWNPYDEIMSGLHVTRAVIGGEADESEQGSDTG